MHLVRVGVLLVVLLVVLPRHAVPAGEAGLTPQELALSKRSGSPVPLQRAFSSACVGLTDSPERR